MSIAQNIQALRSSLPEGVTLVAVSKFHPAEAILEAYEVGQRIFGESRAQELCSKVELLPKDIEWHFIGTLQTNKVKDIAPFISMIHSVDSLKLLKEINKQAKKHGRVIDVLLEVHVAQEATKHGLTPNECVDLINSNSLYEMENIRMRGVMGMATNTDDTDLIRGEFHQIHELFERLKSMLSDKSDSFNQISMGMSHDSSIAIEEGSTMIRVGTSIFGEREY